MKAVKYMASLLGLTPKYRVVRDGKFFVPEIRECSGWVAHSYKMPHVTCFSTFEKAKAWFKVKQLVTTKVLRDVDFNGKTIDITYLH